MYVRCTQTDMHGRTGENYAGVAKKFLKKKRANGEKLMRKWKNLIAVSKIYNIFKCCWKEESKSITPTYTHNDFMYAKSVCFFGRYFSRCFSDKSVLLGCDAMIKSRMRMGVWGRENLKNIHKLTKRVNVVWLFCTIEQHENAQHSHKYTAKNV